jgi:hypothetical protein
MNSGLYCRNRFPFKPRLTTHSTGLAIKHSFHDEVDSSPVNSGVRLFLQAVSFMARPMYAALGFSSQAAITLVAKVGEYECYAHGGRDTWLRELSGRLPAQLQLTRVCRRARPRPERGHTHSGIAH